MIEDVGEAIEEALGKLAAPTAPPGSVPSPDGDGALILVRNGYTLHHKPGPKVGRRYHVFEDLGSYAEWLNRHATDRERTEILMDERKAVAALDPGQEHGELVSCDLKHHPVFSAWAAALDRAMDQKATFAFVRGVGPSILPRESDDQPSGAEILSRELQTLKVASAGQLDVSVDELGYQRYASQGAKQQVSGKLPGRITARMPVFTGVLDPDLGEEREYDLEILLALEPNPDQGKVMLTFTCPGLALVMHQARLDAVAYLRSLLDPTFLVGLGRLHVEAAAASKLDRGEPTTTKRRSRT